MEELFYIGNHCILTYEEFEENMYINYKYFDKQLMKEGKPLLLRESIIKKLTKKEFIDFLTTDISVEDFLRPPENEEFEVYAVLNDRLHFNMYRDKDYPQLPKMPLKDIMVEHGYEKELENLIKELNGFKTINLFSIDHYTDELSITVNKDKELEFSYLIQDRTLVKDGERADIQEHLIGKTSFSNLYQTVLGKIPFINLFKNATELHTVGQIGDKVFPKVEVEYTDKLEYLPTDIFLFNGIVPNGYDPFIEICEHIDYMLDVRETIELENKVLLKVYPLFDNKVMIKLNEVHKKDSEIMFESYNKLLDQMKKHEIEVYDLVTSDFVVRLESVGKLLEDIDYVTVSETELESYKLKKG